MPQVGAWVAATIFGLGTGAAATIVAGLVNTLVGLAINMALSKINAPEGPRPQEITLESRGSNVKRIRHLGRVRTSGTLAFWEWAQVTEGGEFVRRLFKLLLVAEGGMTDVIQWYLDGQPVNVDASGYVTTAPWNKGNIRLRYRRGQNGDGWDGGDWVDMRNAFPGYWTTDHRCRGIGCILATFDDVDTDEISEVYSGGEPEVSALIDGAPCYWINSDDYANTREPARQLCDVLVNPIYGTLKNSDVDEISFAVARTANNEDVPTSGGTRPRYRSGISFALSDSLKNVAQKLLDSMGGRAWINTDGQLQIEAGVWTAPTVTIQERHIHMMEYGAGTNRTTRVTTLVPSYVAPEVRWQETTADPWDDTEAISLWGEGEPKSMDLLAVQHHGQARHLCKQKIAQMNPRRKMKITLGAFGIRLLGEQRVNVNIPRLGLSNTPFWIDSFSFDGTNVVVELLQAAPSSFNWTAGEEGDPPTDAEDYDRDNPTFSTTIDSLVVVVDDGVPYIRVAGTYTASWGYIGMAQFRRNTDTEWTDCIRETSVNGNYRYRTAPLKDGGLYQIRTYVAPGGQTWKQKSTPVVVGGIEVIANNNPPNASDLVSESGSAGGTLVVTFRPDLGANYNNTRLYRAAAGGAFADAVQDGNPNYATSSEVTITRSIPGAGARYWLRSFNASGVASPTTLVGNYP